MQNFMWKIGLCYEISNKMFTCQGIKVNIGNIQIHNNAFWIFTAVTWRQTDGWTEMYKGNKILIFLAFFPNSPKQRQSECIFWCLGLLNDGVNVFWASYGTAHLAYKYWTNCTVLIYCTYSNYTETAPTCSAGQQERNCQADVFWSEVQTLLWNYIVTHIQR